MDGTHIRLTDTDLHGNARFEVIREGFTLTRVDLSRKEYALLMDTLTAQLDAILKARITESAGDT